MLCDIKGCLLQRRPAGRMKLLDQDGMCSVGEVIQPGEIYINKQSPINTRDMVSNPHSLPDNAFKPTPMSWKGVAGQACVVDRVLLTENDEGHRIFKVCIPVQVSPPPLPPRRGWGICRSL